MSSRLLMNRRQMLKLGAAGSAVLATPSVLAQPVSLKFTLDWRFQGVHAAFLLAADKGYFREEGLNVQIDTGDGSSGAVQRVLSNAYDAGFGDTNTMIQVAARAPGTQPVAVYMMYNRAPFVMISKKSANITKPADLVGKKVVTTANSSALTMFPALAKAAGIDASKVAFQNVAPQLMDQMLARGEVDALAGFITTAWINLKALGQNMDDYNVMFYSDFGLASYGNSVMVSRKLLTDNPRAVTGLVKAINRGYQDSQASPADGIAALLKRDPILNRDVEMDRLMLGLRQLMVTPETQKVGIGDIDAARFTRSIEQVAETFSLPRKPEVAEVFNNTFLPPRGERNVRV